MAQVAVTVTFENDDGDQESYTTAVAITAAVPAWYAMAEAFEASRREVIPAARTADVKA